MSDERTPSLLEDAATYPLRGSGWIMITIGAVLSAVLTLGTIAPGFGIVAWFAGLAYFTAFYFDIISSTVNGGDECPDWPDITDLMSDIVMPVVRCIGVWILSFLPLIIVIARMGDDESELRNPAAWAGFAWGAFYFPMAILNVAVGNEMSAALPHRVLPDAIRAMPGYLWLVALLTAVFVLSEIAVVYGAKVPFIGGLLAAGISLYFMMMQARLAGLFYRRELDDDDDDQKDASLNASSPPHEMSGPQDSTEISM
jgi:hypothetical protein